MSEMPIAESSVAEHVVQRRVSRARRWAGVLVLGGLSALHAAVVIGWAIWSMPAVNAARSEARELHPKGDFTHTMAGFPMPERVGPWERVAVTQFDEKGRNLGAGYNAVLGKERQLPVVATVYVYPARPGVELDPYFEGLLEELSAAHGGAKPEHRKNVTLAGRFVGRYAIFGYAEPWAGLKQDIPLRSYIVVYRWRSWWVKWRATTPAPVDAERMKAIVDLTESLLPPEDEERAEAATARSGS